MKLPPNVDRDRAYERLLSAGRTLAPKIIEAAPCDVVAEWSGLLSRGGELVLHISTRAWEIGLFVGFNGVAMWPVEVPCALEESPEVDRFGDAAADVFTWFMNSLPEPWMEEHLVSALEHGGRAWLQVHLFSERLRMGFELDGKVVDFGCIHYPMS